MNIEITCPNKVIDPVSGGQRVCNHVFIASVNDNMTNTVICEGCGQRVHVKTLYPSRWRRVESVTVEVVEKTTIKYYGNTGVKARHKYTHILRRNRR